MTWGFAFALSVPPRETLNSRNECAGQGPPCGAGARKRFGNLSATLSWACHPRRSGKIASSKMVCGFFFFFFLEIYFFFYVYDKRERQAH